MSAARVCLWLLPSEHEGCGRRTFAATTMLQRVARPEEIAHAILWLASDDSSFSTASNLLVDGGASASSHEGF